ncbi:hypothetical protein, partial [Klebsiella michiganensis]|uniref:hypothetical protein n=1 Tax=Klebsiella michiganensis TaxID=1134687 RepID=UPI001C389987
GACVEQDDKGRDARKRAYCLKIQPATGSFARNLIYSTKPHHRGVAREVLINFFIHIDFTHFLILSSTHVAHLNPC